MSDFPPNLEDGEQWLPSDIYEEIISQYDYKPKAKVNNITQNLAIEIKSFDHGGNKVVHVNYGKTKGTGVFIPQMTTPKYVPKLVVRKGTGVFLPSSVTDSLIATLKDKTSEKKDEVIKGGKDGAKKELFQPLKRYGFPETGSTRISK